MIGITAAAVVTLLLFALPTFWGDEGNDASIDPQQRLLARVVFAEGTFEPMPGKIAIARTVLNRVEDDAFPNELEAVVYQRNAFTAVTVRSRLWRLSKDPRQMNDLQKRRWEESLKAAAAAMNGRGDPRIIAYRVTTTRGGEGYFRQLEPVVTLGNHRFYKHAD